VSSNEEKPWQAVLDFWFDELEPRQHFVKDATLDGEIRKRFEHVHHQACNEQLQEWRVTPTGQLAEIIVLDQFSRNLYRDDPRAWSQDNQALRLAKAMVEDNSDQEIPALQRPFVYMPYMHAESLDVQMESVALFTALGNESNLKFALLHRDVIEKFGRFPYRNELLGRESTSEELAYAEKHGSF